MKFGSHSWGLIKWSQIAMLLSYSGEYIMKTHFSNDNGTIGKYDFF